MTLLKEPDFGTPERSGEANVSVEVEGCRCPSRRARR
jgi:formate dehydrogenase major subunit